MPYRSLGKRVGNAVRLAEVIQVFVKYGFADLVQRLGLHEGLPARLLRRLHLIEPASDTPNTVGKRLGRALQELGPTTVKFGQVLSTRPDLFGKALCDDLGELQDRVAPMPFDDMRKVIEDGLGASLDTIYAEFNETPVASASLSQVYRAVLHTGETVAVKVQRPGVRQTIHADLSLMRGIAEWLEEHRPDLNWMNPMGTLDEFERSVRRELDFTLEAHIIKRFARNYKEVEAVFVPGVFDEATCPTVLTMDWVDGVRIDSVAAYPERHCDPKTVALIGCDTLCRQVFEYHFFHADPHPGNVFVLRDNRIAFLDFGMVGHLEKDDVVAMADLLRAIWNEDIDACVQYVLRFSESDDAEDLEGLRHEIVDYLAFEAQTIISSGEVGKGIERLTNILRRHHLQLSPRFSLLLKALATIESTGHKLDPALDIVPILRPYVERLVKQRYSPAQLAREARQNTMQFLRMGRELPQELRGLMSTLRRGRLKVQLHHEKLDNLASVTDRASNRIAFSVIAGSIIVGSSMLISSNSARTLGLIGYSVAAVLGMMLLVSILRSRNF